MIVHNRSQELSKSWSAKARVQPTLQRRSLSVDVVITNLPDSPDVEKVALGPGGVINQPVPVLFSSTTLPSNPPARAISARF